MLLAPHRFCLNDAPWLIWPSVLSDLLIALAYFLIPFAIWRASREGGGGIFPAPWMTWLFVTFIFLCGTTHIFGALTIFWPWYSVANAVKAATAIVSLLTAVRLGRALRRLRQWGQERERLAAEHARVSAHLGEDSPPDLVRLAEAVTRAEEAVRELA